LRFGMQGLLCLFCRDLCATLVAIVATAIYLPNISGILFLPCVLLSRCRDHPLPCGRSKTRENGKFFAKHSAEIRSFWHGAMRIVKTSSLQRLYIAVFIQGFSSCPAEKLNPAPSFIWGSSSCPAGRLKAGRRKRRAETENRGSPI
jgi:hypothetical protein